VEVADFTEPIPHQSNRGRRYVYANPLHTKFLSDCYRRTAAAKGIQHNSVFLGARFNYAIQQSLRLLRWVAGSFPLIRWHQWLYEPPILGVFTHRIRAVA